jgi:hypothetical protein
VLQPEPDVHRALVGPVRPKQEAFAATLLGRTGNNRIKVMLEGGAVFAVDRFRLYALDKVPNQARARITDAELAALPWHGAGPDPLVRK